MMNFLEQAIKAHKVNDLAEAKLQYKKHLKAHPKDANAQQLLGLVFCIEGKFKLAQPFLEESLRLSPNQPHVLTNLGNCEERLGNREKAIACYKQAIQHNANYMEAYKNLALSYQSAGEFSLALTVIKDALVINENSGNLLKLQGLIAKQSVDFPTSIKAYEKVLELQPNAVAARLNLGISLRLDGRAEEALGHYLLLEKNGVDNYQLKHNIANAYSDLGELEKAVNYYYRAIDVNSGYVDSHKNLNDLLWELNDHERYLSSYKKAMLIDSNNIKLHFSYADSLIRASNYNDAHLFLEQLSESFRQNSEYYDLLARCLIRLGDKSKALEMQRRAVSFADVTLEQLVNYARNLIETGNTDAAIEQLEGVVKQDPYDQMAIAYLVDCWRIKGDPKQHQINNYDELVREYNLDSMGAFENIESFCAALKDYLNTLHSAKQQPLEQTLYRGTQTRANLFDNQNELIQLLVQKASLCIEDYKQHVQKISDITPGLAELDKFYFSGSWSVKLKEQGFHVSHVHPMGTLSCCFYIVLPEAVNKEGEHQGWLKVGEPNLDLELKLGAIRYVKPTVGKLVIFPSHMWHGTVPFSTDESRMTIAFDVASILRK